MKIAILGYGVEGKSAYTYLHAKNPKYEIDVFDEKLATPPVQKVKSFLDIDFSSYGAIVRSPSIPPAPIYDKILADRLGRKDFNFTSATQMFFQFCPCPIVGVTGTKGKGTTASLLASILRAAGRDVHLVGNIGIPALDVLGALTPDSLVVYELSSFQLWDLKKSPHVAILTQLDVDHLDIHPSKEDYWVAKANIAKHQTSSDFIIYEKDSKISEDIVKTSPAQKLTYPTGKHESALDSLTIPGLHNRRNAEAAILAAECLGITDPAVFRVGLAAFAGLPHRLRLVREVAGAKYYNDSISTTPGSAIAAIRAFPDSPKIFILGGSSKGADFSELADAIKTGNVKQVILVGPEGPKIAAALASVEYTSTISVEDIPYDMKNVVDVATKTAAPGDIVILSPAAASFDSFKNYSDRGDKFIKAVESL